MQANGMIFWDWNGTLMDDVDFTHSCLNWMLVLKSETIVYL